MNSLNNYIQSFQANCFLLNAIKWQNLEQKILHYNYKKNGRNEMQGQTKGSIHTCLNYSSYTHILDLFDLELFTKTTPNFFEICEKSCFLLQSFLFQKDVTSYDSSSLS